MDFYSIRFHFTNFFIYFQKTNENLFSWLLLVKMNIMGIIFDFDLYEFCTNFSERFTTCILSRFVRIFLNLNALLRVCYLDLYEFDLYDLFGERFSRTNRGIAVELNL